MTYLAQTTLLTAGADPADNQSNGFYVSGTPASTGEMDSWATAIKTFYEACKTAGAMRGMAQNNHIIKFYDVTQPAPNYPVYETTFDFGFAPGAVELPLEVALCVSYKNNSLNTVLRARRRGRVYVSGWGTTQNSVGRPTSTAYTALANAYADYCDDVNVIGGLTAGIYSRVQDIVSEVEEVWCDNAWDTQRRRGVTPSARVSVAVTP